MSVLLVPEHGQGGGSPGNAGSHDPDWARSVSCRWADGTEASSSLIQAGRPASDVGP